MTSISVLLSPKSIAIIGASNDETRIGGRPIRYLKEGGFTGSIYPVNPSRREVQGIKSYACIKDIPDTVECAIIITPAKAVLPYVKECATKGVKGIVILSSGFGESGSAGKLMQDEVIDVALKHGIRILGPNCLGLFNTASNSYLTFSAIFDEVVGTTGRLGLVSQSGGYAGDLVIQAKRVGLSFGSWITTGNESDVEAGEVINAFAHDDNIDVIVAYLESIKNHETFIAGLEAAHAKRKPVIVIKVGKSIQGALAAAAHTASLAGSDDVYNAVFNRYGVFRARTTEEMLDLAYAASRGIFPRGNRLVSLTVSGGIGVLTADFGQDEGLELTPLPNDVRSSIEEMVPNAGTHNPIDLTAKPLHEPELYARALDKVLASNQFDMAYLNIGVHGGMPHAIAPIIESLSVVTKKYPHTPIVIGVMAPQETIALYEQAGYLQYLEPARALRSLAGLYHFHQAWSRKIPKAPNLKQPMPIIPKEKPLSEATAKGFIASAGIPVPKEYLVQNPSEAIEAARKIDQPIAIKVVSSNLLHKTEIGGVALNIKPSEAGATVELIHASVSSHAPDACIEGFLITPMLLDGVECFIGTQVDPVFGVNVTFGLGGIAVELYRDVTTRTWPLDRNEALDMIKSIKGSALLLGYRGSPKSDIRALADAIVNIAALAQANAATVGTIEINPLLVLKEGSGVVALDAVITV